MPGSTGFAIRPFRRSNVGLIGSPKECCDVDARKRTPSRPSLARPMTPSGGVFISKYETLGGHVL
jgi:hypothetical protein